MYHVISTGFTAILLYLISYSFYRIGYYSLQLHRKFWNSVLAAAFLITAIAGVFLALQISYKWNIPFIKTVLRWHVEFGIGMAITGLFHFIWHLNYYGKFFAKIAGNPEKPEFQKLTSAEIKTNLFIIGFVSSSIQFLLMREIMNVTGGYELITGSFLGSWLIGSAIGSSLAGKSTLNDIRKINLVFSISPIISLSLMLFLSRVFLSPGETPSFLAAIIYTLLVLIPFCLVSGFTFIKLITIAGSENKLIPGKSFSIETTGGIVAGIIIALLSAGLISTYKLLMLIILLSVGYVLTTYYIHRPKTKISANFFIIIVGILIIFLNPDLLFRQILLPGIKVTGTKDTPYGNITKGKYKGEESLYYNQRLLAYKDDATEREEDIHYAMLQSESPEKVIIISGSPQSHIPEILKYPVSSIIYIERDPALVKYETSVGDKFPGKVIVVNRDAYRYIRNSTESVDVIILLIPPPSTLLLNRYYTSEFFSDVKKRLKPDGIFMCSPGPGDDYFNKESLNLYSSIYNSLAANFKNVKPVAGNKLYFIASDKAISLSFCQLVEKRGIKNIYVSADFLEDDLIIRKSDEINALIDHGIKQNRFSFPVACLHFQSYQFSKNLSEKVPAIVLMFIVFALPVATIKRRNLVMYFSASALAGFEIIILLSLQVMVGNMYQLTGLIIAGLMTGLAVGSGINISFLNTISLRNKVIYLILFYIIFGLIYNYMIELKSGLLSVVVIMISGFLPALFTGHIFRELTGKTEGIATSPAIYSADLAGSAFGFIIISGFAVPVLGIKVSVFLLAALVFGGILFGTIRNK
jgi:predicted membrane-bound spermidine synthase